MIIGKAAGIDVINIARKGLWGQFIPPRFLNCGYCYLVFPELITGGHPSGNQSYRCSQPPHWDQTLCVAALLETRRYYFLLIWDPPAGWLPLTSPQKLSVTGGRYEEVESRSLMCRGYMLRLLHHVWHTTSLCSLVWIFFFFRWKSSKSDGQPNYISIHYFPTKSTKKHQHLTCYYL
jgi:hypothetical protein